MRFAFPIALFSILSAILPSFGALSPHGSRSHNSRTLSERQYRPHPRPRALIDICVSLDAAAILGLGGILALPVGLLTDLNLCLCLNDLDLYLDTHADVFADLRTLLGSTVDIKLFLTTLINSHGTNCNALPANSHRACTNSNPCHAQCNHGFQFDFRSGQCVCAFPNTECNGKCGSFPNGCSSAIPKARKRLESRITSLVQAQRTCSRKESVCGIPNSFGRSDFECLDTSSCSESCGGCTTHHRFSSPTESTGRNCHNIANVLSVKCESSNCVVQSCKSGYSPNPAQNECIASPSSDQAALQRDTRITRSFYSKNEISTRGSVFARNAKPIAPIFIDLCDLSNILGLYGVDTQASVNGLGLGNLLNDLVKELHLSGYPYKNCGPHPVDLSKAFVDLDLCNLLNGLRLGTIKTDLRVDLRGSQLDTSLNNLIRALSLGGSPACKNSPSTATCTSMRGRSLDSRTLNTNPCPLLEKLRLGGLKANLNVELLGEGMDNLLNGILKSMDLGGFPHCGSNPEGHHSIQNAAPSLSDSTRNLGDVVDVLIESLSSIEAIVQSSSCDEEGNTNHSSDALDSVLITIDQLFASILNVQDNLISYFGSLKPLLDALSCSLYAYSKVDVLQDGTADVIEDLIPVCHVLTTMLNRSLQQLSSCGCSRDGRLVEEVRSHASQCSPSDDPAAASDPSLDLVSQLMQDLGLDDLMDPSTSTVLARLLGSLLGGSSEYPNLMNQILLSLRWRQPANGGLNLAKAPSDGHDLADDSDTIHRLLDLVSGYLDGVVNLKPLLQSLHLTTTDAGSSTHIPEDLLAKLLDAVDGLLDASMHLDSDPSNLSGALQELLGALDGCSSSDGLEPAVIDSLRLTSSIVNVLRDIVNELLSGMDSCGCRDDSVLRLGIKAALDTRGNSLGH